MSNRLIIRSLEEIIIVASSIVMAVTVTPFAIYRFYNNQYLAAALEILCVGIMSAIGIYVWKTRKIEKMATVTSVFMVSGLVAFIYLLGTPVLFWFYPIIMTVYFICSLQTSLLLFTPAILAILPILLKHKSNVEIISIIVTFLICQVFGYILSRKNSQRFSHLEELINQDGLTGALNRRAFDDRANFLHSLALRQYRKKDAIASLILFDIDNFKTVNDEFGHIEGDQILINLTRLVKSNIRTTDELYRYGGEEFAIIANGADALKATELAEKVRITLENSTSVSQVTSVTASFGVAELHRLEHPHHWIDRADKSLYRAKRAGKNRVFIANYNHHDESERSFKSAHA